MDPQILATTAKVFRHYYKFMKDQKYDTILKIQMYDDIELHLRWKKCFRKRFVTTEMVPVNDYVFQKDDIELMQMVAKFFEPNQLQKIITWYEANLETPK